MQCPTCDVTLTLSERQGIEMDYCPKCRGVWLDRGELDKIIERSAGADFERDREREDGRPEYREGYKNDRDDYKRRYKRKSFLGEIFDFD